MVDVRVELCTGVGKGIMGINHPLSYTEEKLNKPVGFYGPIAPPVPNAPVLNAPSSKCPRASIAARRRASCSIRISRRASCCCSSTIAGIAIGANFKIYLLRQFCSTGDTDTKKMDQNFEIRIRWFLRIFWNFQKGVNLDHYGRGQTRSE